MANDAEIVAVELIGNLDQFDRTVKQSATEFGNDMQRIEGSAAKAEQGVTRAMNKAGLSARQMAQQSRNLGYQISDIGQQLAVGTSPFIVLAQQGSQVANALEGTTGVVGRFAGFLSGPWGAALLAATTILGGFLFRSKETTDSVEDLVEKLKEQERQAKLNDEANELFARSIEGVTKAADEAEKAVEELRLSKKGEAEQTAENIRKNLDEAEALRETTRARIADARALYEFAVQRATRGGPQGEASALGLTGRLEAIERLERELGNADRQAERLRTSLDRAISAQTVEREMRSAEEVINDRYDAQIDGAAAAANASKRSQDALAAEIRRINEARDAELERYRETERERRRVARERQRDQGSTTPFINPVGSGPVTGRFGETRSAAGGGTRAHAGIDIAVPVGTSVKAAAGGTIIEAGTLPGYGNVVIIDHGGGTITRYAHLSRIDARRGDTVGQGEQIGLSGGARGAPGSGNSRGPHLHYEVRRGGRAVDPRQGAYPTDVLGSQADSIEALRRQAEEELRRRQAFENELAKLQGDEVEARQALITSAEQIAALELESIEISRRRYDDNLNSLVEQGKLTAEESAQLRGINEERARLRAELVRKREDERKFRMAEAAAQRQAQFESDQRGDQADVLQSQLDVARTQQERRDLERRLLDLQFAEERARNDYLIAFYERLKVQEGISESEKAEAEAAARAAELRNQSIDERRDNAQTSSDRSTAGPLESFFNEIPSTAEQINEALENVAAGGLATFTDALTDAIVNFRSLGDVGLAVLQNITAALVRMAIQQIILKTIGKALGQGATAATVAEAGAAATAWAPAAALASLATLGANAAPAAAALAATTALSFGLAASGQAAQGLATGGPVVGPGGPTEDAVPLWGSNGEYMIKASSARKLGRATLDRMNLTGELPYGYALGGPIGGYIGPSSGMAARSGGGSGTATLDQASIGQLARIVADAAGAMPDVKLFPTLDPAAALQASLATPGGQRAFFDFVSDNSSRFKAMINQ